MSRDRARRIGRGHTAPAARRSSAGGRRSQGRRTRFRHRFSPTCTRRPGRMPAPRGPGRCSDRSRPRVSNTAGHHRRCWDLSCRARWRSSRERIGARHTPVPRRTDLRGTLRPRAPIWRRIDLRCNRCSRTHRRARRSHTETPPRAWAHSGCFRCRRAPHRSARRGRRGTPRRGARCGRNARRHSVRRRRSPSRAPRRGRRGAAGGGSVNCSRHSGGQARRRAARCTNRRDRRVADSAPGPPGRAGTGCRSRNRHCTLSRRERGRRRGFRGRRVPRCRAPARRRVRPRRPTGDTEPDRCPRRRSPRDRRRGDCRLRSRRARDGRRPPPLRARWARGCSLARHSEAPRRRAGRRRGTRCPLPLPARTGSVRARRPRRTRCLQGRLPPAPNTSR